MTMVEPETFVPLNDEAPLRCDSLQGRPVHAFKRQVSGLGMEDPVGEDDSVASLGNPCTKFGDSVEQRSTAVVPTSGSKLRGGLLSYSKMELTLAQIEASPSSPVNNGGTKQNAKFTPSSTEFAFSTSKTKADRIRESLLRRVFTDTAPQMPSKRGSAESLQDQDKQHAPNFSARKLLEASAAAIFRKKSAVSPDQAPRPAKRVGSRSEMIPSDRPPKIARRVDSRTSLQLDSPPKMATRVRSKPSLELFNMDSPPKMATRVRSKPSLGLENLDAPPKIATRVASKPGLLTLDSISSNSTELSPTSGGKNFEWS